jgi:hypothetical protein
MRLINLKGALTVFAWGCLSDSSIPAKIKEPFTAEQGGNLDGVEFDDAILGLGG